MPRRFAWRSYGAALALALIATLGAGAQDSDALRAIFVVTAGVAVPVGDLASQTSPAPTAYVGLAFRRGQSRTSFEVGESFTTFSAAHEQRATISVAALSVTRTIPLRPSLETYLRFGLGQSWANGTAADDRILSNASHFGVALVAGTGLRLGGRVGALFAVHYMALVHSGAVLQVVPIELGLSLR